MVNRVRAFAIFKQFFIADTARITIFAECGISNQYVCVFLRIARAAGNMIISRCREISGADVLTVDSGLRGIPFQIIDHGGDRIAVHGINIITSEYQDFRADGFGSRNSEIPPSAVLKFAGTHNAQALIAGRVADFARKLCAESVATDFSTQTLQVRARSDPA